MKLNPVAGPLSGINIVSVGINLPGPLTTYHLARLGASILKVEPPSLDPLKTGSREFYEILTQNQKILILDLKEEKDRLNLDSHLEDADLLITSSRPEALERISLDRKRMQSRFPKLCLLNIFGFPAPNQSRAGHDLTYQAQAGLLRPPHMPATCLADFAVAQEASLKAVSLLFEKEKSGVGGYGEVSLAGALELYPLPLKFGLTVPTGPLGGGRPDYNIYKAKEGWIAVAVLEKHFRAKFQKELQLGQFDYDEVKAKMLQRTASEWEKWAEQNDLPMAAVKEF